MTLFNKGIYKSTLRRYKWGSILYFVLLFQSVILRVMFDSYLYSAPGSMLYDFEVLYSSILLAIGVPIVTGALVYRFMHSKKYAIFINSLPVSRTSVYISTVLASLTLMALPVIASGIIFFLLALTTHAECITLVSCLVWTGYNLMSLFMMFACASFVAMLTGSTIVSIGLNFLLHGILPVIVLCFSGFANMFLWGYTNESAIMERVVSGSFPAWIVMNSPRDFEFQTGRMVAYLLISLVLYGLGLLLYKKRNLETAEDVAGFKILNPVFKYLLTFLVTSVAFGIWGQGIDNAPVPSVMCMLIVSAICYFGTEMVLKKTMKVWRKSWKGFLVFVVLFAVMASVFMFTSFFGYETRIPDADEVESAVAYSVILNEEPEYFENEEIVSRVINAHREMISQKEFYGDGTEYINLKIGYKLKNGKSLKRRYSISEAERKEIIGSLYEVPEYKRAFELPLSIRERDIIFLEYNNMRVYGEPMLELHRCIAEDIKNHSYEEIKSENAILTLEYCYIDDDGKETTHNRYTNVPIPECFENTVKWFSENAGEFKDVVD